MKEDLEKYRNPDGSIDWGKRAMEQMHDNSSLINDNSSSNKKHLDLEDLTVFKLADELSTQIWDIVSKWDWFAKKTIGDQVVRSADSVGANIAEGYGRYFFGEYLVFLYYARGSLYETSYWVKKAKERGLVTDDQLSLINNKLDKLPLELNKVIKIIKSESKKLKWQKR